MTCRGGFWFSGLKPIQTRLQICNSPWVSICWHNQEHNAALLPTRRMFCFRVSQSISVSTGSLGNYQVKFVALVKPHSNQSLPSPGLPSRSLFNRFQTGGAFPAWMSSPCPADVYQGPVGAAWLQSKPAACRKGKSMRVPGLRDLRESRRLPSTLWAVSGSCDQIPQRPQTHWKKTCRSKKCYYVGLIYYRKGITAAEV